MGARVRLPGAARGAVPRHVGQAAFASCSSACCQFRQFASGQVLSVAIPVPPPSAGIEAMRSFPRKTLSDHGMNATPENPAQLLVTALLHGLAPGVLLGSAVVQAGPVEHRAAGTRYFIVAALPLLMTAVSS